MSNWIWQQTNKHRSNTSQGKNAVQIRAKCHIVLLWFFVGFDANQIIALVFVDQCAAGHQTLVDG